MSRSYLFAAAALIASSGAAMAASPTFTTIDSPGDPTFNQLLAITNSGDIAGYFGSGAAGHPNQAYLIAAPYTRFQPFRVIGSVQTQATALSGTTVAGFWSGTDMGLDGNGAPQDANYGFVRIKTSAGAYQTILIDGKAAGVPATAQVLGVNASYAVGFYVDGNGNSHGYAYNLATSVLMPVTIPGAKQVSATSINKSNLIAGFYSAGDGTTHAFLAPLTGGTPIKFSVPGATATQFFGVNSNGEAVGTYSIGGVSHGLLFNPANGEWQTLDDPNAVEIPGFGTVVNGLNDKGQAVGFFFDAAGNCDGMLVNNAF